MGNGRPSIYQRTRGRSVGCSLHPSARAVVGSGPRRFQASAQLAARCACQRTARCDLFIPAGIRGAGEGVGKIALLAVRARQVVESAQLRGRAVAFAGRCYRLGWGRSKRSQGVVIDVPGQAAAIWKRSAVWASISCRRASSQSRTRRWVLSSEIRAVMSIGAASS